MKKNYFKILTSNRSTRNILFSASLLTLSMMSGLFSSSVFAQQQKVVLTSGSTWTVPVNADVSSITVECWGAGGGGAYTSNGNSAGGAGGGGAYAQTVFTSFSTGQILNYEVGIGGAGTTGTNAGGDTWFYLNNAGGVSAAGGKGAVNNSTLGGLGGSATASFGDITFSGGNGGKGSYSSGAVCGDELASGAGGTAATSAANGIAGGNASTSTGGFLCNGNNSTAGVAPSNVLFTGYTSTGGSGMTYAGPGTNGIHGAGGGGGVSATNNGGNGGDGIVVITYTQIDCSAAGIDTQVACKQFTWINGLVYTANENSATHTLVGGAANGCDSIVTLKLTIKQVEVSTSQLSAFTFSANAAVATYQWINCNGNTPISGATNKTFTASANGSYAVIVTANGCSDTSACITVSTLGVNSIEAISGINIFPNPTKDLITITIDNTIDGQYIVDLLDATGRVISTQTMNEHSLNVSLIDYESGIYLVRISNGDRQSIQRVIKE